MTNSNFYLTFTVLVNNERWGEKIKIEADNFEEAGEKANIVLREYMRKIFNSGNSIQTRDIKLSNMEEGIPYQPKSLKQTKENFKKFISRRNKNGRTKENM